MKRHNVWMNRSGISWLVLWLVIVSISFADDSKLDVTFEFGYKGVVPQSMRIVPVTVRIRNRLRNLTGRIEIFQPSQRGHEVTLVQKVNSPAPSNLTFTLYPRAEVLSGLNGFNLEGRVVFDDKSVDTFSDRATAKTPKRLILHCGMPAYYLKHTEQLPKPAENKPAVYCKHNYQFISFAPFQLPTHALGYDSVHALMLNGAVFNQLSSKQQAALTTWVFHGGRILLYTPNGSPTIRPWLRGMLPAVGELGVLRAERIGAGLLIFQPYQSTRDLPFWANEANEETALRLLPEISYTRSLIYPSGRSPKAYGLFELFTERNKSRYGLPGLFWLGLIIAVYCVIIGPLDWWLTKRTGRHWLTWPFFAVAIIAFSFVSYWYSQVVQSSPMSAITLNILDSYHNSSEAQGESRVWIHSTGNFNFEISSDKPGTIFNCRESKPSDQSPAARSTIRNKLGGESQLQCRIPVFSSKQFTADWSESMDLKIIPSTSNPRLIQLDPGLEIERAAIATSYGLREMTYTPSTGDLIGANAFTPWPNVIANFQVNNYEVSQGLPTIRELQDYLLIMSFAGLDISGKTDGLETFESFQRSEWEVSLNISPGPNQPARILFIFYKPTQPLNTYSMNHRIPNSLDVNCQRYWLPNF